jgi:hypothetical protein
MEGKLVMKKESSKKFISTVLDVLIGVIIGVLTGVLLILIKYWLNSLF